MKSQDIKNIQLLMEKYEGEWEDVITEGELPQGNHLAYQSGYTIRIGDHEAQVENGIRGKNFPYNVRVVGNKIYKSYVK
jgi:hypothetical protein